MFEEESEDYRKYLKSKFKFFLSEPQFDLACQGFKDGYNKANEWHKVKDGDLPKAYQKCYFIYSNVYGEDGKISFSKSDIKVLTGIYAFFLDEETDEETTEPCFYDDINDDEIDLKEVYAWKEIVLPEGE